MRTFNFFQNWLISAFVTLALTSFSIATAQTDDRKCRPECESELTGFYFGGFGGWGTNRFDAVQRGIAFFFEAKGGPLNVNASGETNTSGYGFGGGHFGYEWLGDWVDRNCKGWYLTPGVELEGYFFRQHKTANLSNPTTRLPEHLFVDTFRMRTAVVIADGTLALTNKYITPYAGGGLGAAIISLHGADSEQVAPVELGVNHFNSDTSSFDWTFAAQLKAGLRRSLFQYMRIFAEYRFLFIANSDFRFGNTVYSFHAETTNWILEFGHIYNHMVSMGIDFTF